MLAQTNVVAADTTGDIPDNMEEEENDADQGTNLLLSLVGGIMGTTSPVCLNIFISQECIFCSDQSSSSRMCENHMTWYQGGAVARE